MSYVQLWVYFLQSHRAVCALELCTCLSPATIRKIWTLHDACIDCPSGRTICLISFLLANTPCNPDNSKNRQYPREQQYYVFERIANTQFIIIINNNLPCIHSTSQLNDTSGCVYLCPRLLRMQTVQCPSMHPAKAKTKQTPKSQRSPHLNRICLPVND